MQRSLFEKAPDPKDGDPLYTYLRTSEHCAEHRDALQTLWNRFDSLGLADPDFVDRFPREVGARIWEMRLACTFHDWGWKLRPSPKPGHGPDFGVVLGDGGVAWVEATVPRDAQKSGEPVGTKPGKRVIVGGEVDRKVMLRYLSVIEEKRKKWARWVEKDLVTAADGFVIAISGSVVPEVHFEIDELPRIGQIAYGLGHKTYLVPIDSDQEPHVGPREAMPVVMKGPDVEIQAGLFQSSEAEEVSALVFSGAHFQMRPRSDRARTRA